jgi:hypothetical protein
LLLTLLVTPVAYSMFEDWAKIVNVVGARRIGRVLIARLRWEYVRRKHAE